MAAVTSSEPKAAEPAQTEVEAAAQNGSASVEGTGPQSEKAKAKAEAKAKAKAEREAKKAANVRILCPVLSKQMRSALVHSV